MKRGTKAHGQCQRQDTTDHGADRQAVVRLNAKEDRSNEAGAAPRKQDAEDSAHSDKPDGLDQDDPAELRPAGAERRARRAPSRQTAVAPSAG